MGISEDLTLFDKNELVLNKTVGETAICKAY